MGKYVLENIHAAYPQARLAIVVASRAGMIRDLLRAYPWLEVVEANRRNPATLFSLFWNFCNSDRVITQYAGKRGGTFGLGSKLVARLLASRGELIGFNDASWWNRVYDKLLPVRPTVAVAEHDRELLRAAGIPITFPFPTLQYKEDQAVLQRFEVNKGEYLVVHLFAGNKSRGLMPKKKHELLVALTQKLPGVRILVSGGKGDREEAVQVAEGTSATVIAGEVTLQELANLIAKAQGVVSLDTGVAHIAAQLKKSLVVLRTCIAPNWWFEGQYGAEAPIHVLSADRLCAPGHQAHEGYPVCLNGIDANGVASQAAATINS